MYHSFIDKIIIVLMCLFLFSCSNDEIDLYEPNPLIDINNQFEVKTIWTLNVGDGVDDRPLRLTPVYAYEHIYVADTSGTITAIHPKKGTILWKKEFKLSIAGGPAVGDDLLAVGTNQGELLVLEASTGKEKWRAQVSSEIISSPAIGEGYVVVRTVDGRIYAFDAKTGQEKWFYDETLPSLTLRGTSAPLIINGGVFSGFSNGKLAVFFLKNGQPAWEKRIAIPVGHSEIQRLVDVDLKPLVNGQTLFIGSFNGNLVSLNAMSGEMNWQRELSMFQEMAMHQSQLLVTHENSHFSSLDTKSGGNLWTQKDLYRRQLTTPSVYKKWAIVGDFEGYLHWITLKDGQIVSREKIDSSGISATPLVIDDTIILLSRDGTLIALKKANK
jgi:outer membrane protein assembly factor BamB